MTITIDEDEQQETDDAQTQHEEGDHANVVGGSFLHSVSDQSWLRAKVKDGGGK